MHRYFPEPQATSALRRKAAMRLADIARPVVIPVKEELSTTPRARWKYLLRKMLSGKE
jgi:hypothetical protein